jgi:hypothetical protein
MQLGGVIYLQSIAEKRMKGTTRRNLDMFRRLCGKDALSQVVLGTTNWGDISEDVGKRRESQLVEGFWKELKASNIKRFYQTQESAQDLLDVILGQLNKSLNILQVQEELVTLAKIIPTTAAGKELRYTLEQVLAMQSMGDESERMKELMTSVRKQVDELRIPLGWRIKRFFMVNLAQLLEIYG